MIWYNVRDSMRVPTAHPQQSHYQNRQTIHLTNKPPSKWQLICDEAQEPAQSNQTKPLQLWAILQLLGLEKLIHEKPNTQVNWSCIVDNSNTIAWPIDIIAKCPNHVTGNTWQCQVTNKLQQVTIITLLYQSHFNFLYFYYCHFIV